MVELKLWLMLYATMARIGGVRVLDQSVLVGFHSPSSFLGCRDKTEHLGDPE